MGLISPPKWPSVNPFSHPLGSKIGRKPMVNPSKWVNLKSNFLKYHHRNQAISGIEKARKMAYFRAFLALLSCRLSLAELRSATSGFEAVLLTFLHTRIAGQEASFLQNRSVLSVCLQQCSGDTVTDSTSLTGCTTTANVYENVKFVSLSQLLPAADERSAFRVSRPRYSSMSLLLMVILPVPGTRYTLAIDFFLLPVP